MIKSHSFVWALSIGLAFSVDQISTASAQSIHSPFGGAIGRAIPTPEGAQDLGKRSGSEPIEVSITLNRNHEAELEQLLAEQQTPGSPAYQRFLTSDEFDRDFGPTPDQIEFVTGSLKEGGFQIVKISTDRTVVTASAPSGVAENFFRTEIHSIRQKDGKVRYANAAPVVIPANIASMVKGVRLHNLVIAHTFLHRGIHSVQETGNAKPDTLSSPYYHNSYGINAALPAAIATSFDLPVQHGYYCGGYSVAVIIDSDCLNSDLNTFFAQEKLTRTGAISRVSINGGILGSESNGYDSGETILDVETIASLAPAANVRIYVMGDLSNQSIYEAYASVVNNDSSTKVEVVNSSFGGDENGGVDPSIDSIIQKGVGIGITFSCSSGDSGASYVSYPASNPYVTAVGGTSYTFNTSTGVYVSETGLNDSTNFNGTLQGGGGISSVYSFPWYQKGVSGVSTSGRNIPDVSFPGEFVAVYQASQGGWSYAGGTSWSAPIYSAWQLGTNSITHKRFGNVNPSLYNVFRTSGYTDFRDITLGNNGTYNCTKGYDHATGIGSLKGYSLSNALK